MLALLVDAGKVSAHEPGDEHGQEDLADERLEVRQRSGQFGLRRDVAVSDGGDRDEREVRHQSIRPEGEVGIRGRAGDREGRGVERDEDRVDRCEHATDQQVHRDRAADGVGVDFERREDVRADQQD